MVGPVSPCPHPIVISPIPEYVLWINILSNWQNPYISFLIGGVRAVMAGKAKWFPPHPIQLGILAYAENDPEEW